MRRLFVLLLTLIHLAVEPHLFYIHILYHPLYSIPNLFFQKYLLKSFTVRRVCNTKFSDNACDQIVVGHVEGRIINLYAGSGHWLFVPHVSDLFRFSLFNDNIVAGGGVHIDGGGRRAHVERYIVSLSGESRHGSTDLVGGISVGRHTIASYEHSLNLAFTH